MGDILEQLANASLELAAYASYAEIVGGVSHNRKQIREWCDKVFDLNHQREKAEDEADALATAPAQHSVAQQGVEMVLVPKEPTVAMLEAGNKILDFTKLSPKVWAAMLAAAPEQEKSNG